MIQFLASLSWPVLTVALVIMAALSVLVFSIALKTVGFLCRAFIYGMELVSDTASRATGVFLVNATGIVFGTATRKLGTLCAPIMQKRCNKDEKPSESDYATAVEILGLPARFKQIHVEEHHHLLAMAVHRDRTNGCSTWLSSQVNAAKDVIFKHHGWE